jgi:hypothetical protein
MQTAAGYQIEILIPRMTKKQTIMIDVERFFGYGQEDLIHLGIT